MRSHLLGLASVCASACAPHAAPNRPASTLDDTALRADTLAFLAAGDRDDERAFAAAAGTSFVMLDDGRVFDRAFALKRLASRRERGAPPRSRTCKDEQLRRGSNVAVYIADCIEHAPAAGDRPASEWEGWNTIVWTHDGTAWTVAYWGWQKAGTDAELDRWNDIYRKSTGFKRTPNQHLIDSVKGRTPGTALDLMMGQGRNAVYLATQGWKVTGVDLSDQGIAIARQAAAAQQVQLDAVVTNIDAYDLGTDRWDLVTMIYAGADPQLIARVKPSIRSGGLFVAENFFRAREDGTTAPAFRPGELAKHFAGWKILRDEVVEDIADWGLTKHTLARFVAQKP
jgi:hypothetical protein